MRVFLAVVLMGAFSGSCNYGVSDISSVPDNPTYNRDIYPFFRDHCLLCHSSPSNRGAPSSFRLDVYASSNGMLGAMDEAASCAGDVKIGKMPPGAKAGDGVGPNGMQMLQKWADNGAPE